MCMLPDAVMNADPTRHCDPCALISLISLQHCCTCRPFQVNDDDTDGTQRVWEPAPVRCRYVKGKAFPH